MVRRNFTMTRLSSSKARQSKYSKRKMGIIKKANEISTLCDVDVALVMISPSRKPALYVGKNKDLSEVLERLSTMSLDEREERRSYTTKLLNKAYADNPNAQLFQGNISAERIEEIKAKQAQLQEMRETLREKTEQLKFYWTHPENIDDLEEIKRMEAHLVARLAKVREIKFLRRISKINEEGDKFGDKMDARRFSV